MGQCFQFIRIHLLPSNERLLDYSEPKNFSFEASRLAKAASKGDLETVQNLVVECTTISINEKDEYGCTALYRAVENNHLQVAKLLLELRASPNEPTKTGKTCLHAAAENGDFDMCSLLLNNNANISTTIPSLQHMTPLHFAIQKNHVHICELLLRNGAPLNPNNPTTASTTFSSSSSTGDLSPYPKSSIASILHIPKFTHHHRSLSGGSSGSSESSSMMMTTAAATSPSSSSSQQPSCYSPMLMACSLGFTDIVSLLLQYNASIYEHDLFSGLSCLMICSEQGHDITAYYLINQTNLTPQEQEHYVNEICEVSSHHGWTCLHFASSKGHGSVLQVLLQFGALINSVDSLGRTALHYASLRGFPDCVRILIDYGADITIKDEEGKVALDLATETLQYYNIQTQFKRSLIKRQEMLRHHMSIPSIVVSNYNNFTVDSNITSSPGTTNSTPYR